MSKKINKIESEIDETKKSLSVKRIEFDALKANPATTTDLLTMKEKEIYDLDDKLFVLRNNIWSLKKDEMDQKQQKIKEEQVFETKKRPDVPIKEIKEEEDDEPVIKRTSKRQKKSLKNSTVTIFIAIALLIWSVALFWVGDTTGYNRGYEDCQKDLIEITESYR